MAAITGNRADSAAAPATEPQSGEPTPRFAPERRAGQILVVGGAVLVIAVMIVSLAIWGRDGISHHGSLRGIQRRFHQLSPLAARRYRRRH